MCDVNNPAMKKDVRGPEDYMWFVDVIFKTETPGPQHHWSYSHRMRFCKTSWKN